MILKCKLEKNIYLFQENDGGLERWGKSLNGLTKLSKFKELGTLMYGDPAKGPSIVSR